MSRGNDSRTGDTYGNETYGNDARRDYNERNDAYGGESAGSRFPFPGPSLGWRPTFLGRGRSADDRSGSRGFEGPDEGWLDEGLITFLLVGGVVLFLFPEPATSMVGIVMIVLGVVGWIADALS